MSVRPGIVSKDTAQPGDGDVDLAHFLASIGLCLHVDAIVPYLSAELIMGDIPPLMGHQNLQQLKQDGVEPSRGLSGHQNAPICEIQLAC